MRKVVNFIFVFVFAFFFVACGGGGSTPPVDTPTVTLNGIAVDNYISGATVCIDTNKDNICNNGETTTTTNSVGAFTFEDVTLTTDMVIIAYGGRDADTNESFPYIIKNLATNTDSNDKVILSSLNTLVTDYKLLTNKSLTESRVAIANFIASTNSANIIEDIIANKSTLNTEFLRSLKIFQMVASINDINDSNNSALSFKAIAQAIVANENLQHDDTISVTVDNTSKQITNFVSAPVFMDIPTPTVQSGTTFVMNLDFVESPDGGTIGYSLSGGDSGLFEIIDNKIYFKIAPFFAGNVGDRTTKAFNLTASVGGKSVEKNIDLTLVMATPISPVATFTSFSTNEDVNFTGTLTATDTDTNLSSLSYSKVLNPSLGTVVVNPNGSFTYSPTANYYGSDRFDYNISDGINNITQSVNITIVPINDAPIITSSDTVAVNENQINVIQIVATDIENNPVTYQLSDYNVSYFDINSSGYITFKNVAQSDYEFAQQYRVNVKVFDGSDTTTQLLTINLNNDPNESSNDAPTDISLSPTSINENNTPNVRVGYLSTTDIDNATGFVYTIVGGADSASFGIANINELQINTSTNFEVKSRYEVRIRTTDSGVPAAFYEKDFNITIVDVNEVATFDAIIPQNFNQGVYSNFVVKAHETDRNATLATLISTTGNTFGTTDFAVTDIDGNNTKDINITVSGTGTDAQVGQHTFKIYVKQTDNNTNIYQDIVVNIVDVNDAPTYPSTINDVNISYGSNTTLTFAIADGDAHPSQTIDINATSADTSKVTINPITTTPITNSGTISLTLNGLEVGSSLITVNLKDNGGTANSGDDTSSFSFTAIVRGNGNKIYEDNNVSNPTTPVNFDGRIYDWNATKQWYEDNNTILMPIKILTNEIVYGVYGNNLSKIAPGHYVVAKSNLITDTKVTTEDDRSMETVYQTAASGVTKTASSDNFQHDATNKFFVSKTIKPSGGGTGYETNTYANWSLNNQYCIQYGEGWRIPTIVEMGSSSTRAVNGYIPAYMGNSNEVIYSSTDAPSSKKWVINPTHGFTSDIAATSTKHLRCVYVKD
jgi:VCBS repeat-containing protein